MNDIELGKKLVSMIIKIKQEIKSQRGGYSKTNFYAKLDEIFKFYCNENELDPYDDKLKVGTCTFESLSTNSQGNESEPATIDETGDKPADEQNDSGSSETNPQINGNDKHKSQKMGKKQSGKPKKAMDEKLENPNRSNDSILSEAINNRLNSMENSIQQLFSIMKTNRHNSQPRNKGRHWNGNGWNQGQRNRWDGNRRDGHPNRNSGFNGNNYNHSNNETNWNQNGYTGNQMNQGTENSNFRPQYVSPQWGQNTHQNSTQFQHLSQPIPTQFQPNQMPQNQSHGDFLYRVPV